MEHDDNPACCVRRCFGAVLRCSALFEQQQPSRFVLTRVV